MPSEMCLKSCRPIPLAMSRSSFHCKVRSVLKTFPLKNGNSNFCQACSCLHFQIEFSLDKIWIKILQWNINFTVNWTIKSTWANFTKDNTVCSQACSWQYRDPWSWWGTTRVQAIFLHVMDTIEGQDFQAEKCPSIAMSTMHGANFKDCNKR